MCAVTRAAGETSELIRFVAAPDGLAVADIDHKLPGRGMWLTCSWDVVEKAIKSKAFARALKGPVLADPDLAARVGRLLRRRAIETLALANKSGQVLTGFQKVDAAIAAGKVHTLLGAADGAADGRGKLERKFQAIQRARGVNAVNVTILSNEEISLAMGRPGVVHAAVTPGGLADRFVREARRVALYEASGGEFDGERQPQAPTKMQGGTDNV